MENRFMLISLSQDDNTRCADKSSMRGRT